jgi:hypothetical protein
MAASTITYTAKTTGSPQSNFMNMRNDGQHQPMLVANGIQTQDATASPVTSPIAQSSSTATTLVVPNSAIRFHIVPLTNSINVSETSSVTTYLTAPTGVITTVECANMANIYLKANTGTATGSTFWFDCV